jgi:hypothetical protein
MRYYACVTRQLDIDYVTKEASTRLLLDQVHRLSLRSKLRSTWPSVSSLTLQMPPKNARNTVTSKYYRQAIDFWESPTIDIIGYKGESREVIARFPLEFVQRGGNNTWHYVLEVVRQLVSPSDGLIFLPNEMPANLASPPYPGTFFYNPSSKSRFIFYRKPVRHLILINRDGVASISFTSGPTHSTFARPADADGTDSEAPIGFRGGLGNQ